MIGHPAVVHFLDAHTAEYPYLREVRRLELAARGWPIQLADAVATLTRSVPLLALDAAKKFLRPVYRKVFGVRAVSVSPRI